MTRSKDFQNAVQAWYDRHGEVECNQKNGRKGLIDTYLKFCKPLTTREQASVAVTNQLRKVRHVIYPWCTNHNVKRRKVGDETGKSKVWKKKKSS